MILKIFLAYKRSYKRTKKVERSKKVNDFGAIRNHLVLYDLKCAKIAKHEINSIRLFRHSQYSTCKDTFSRRS